MPDLLIIVSSEKSEPILRPLAEACHRARCDWAVFMTNDGVKIATDHHMQEILKSASTAVACHDSWDRHMAHTDCPITLGSQTNNSELVGTSKRVVSL